MSNSKRLDSPWYERAGLDVLEYIPLGCTRLISILGAGIKGMRLAGISHFKTTVLVLNLWDFKANL